MASKRAELEALLFYYGEPISVIKIARLLKTEKEELEKLLADFANALAADGERGLMITRSGETVQLVTKPETEHIGASLVREEFREQLTPAALETLSLIAYLGPMTRMTVDYVRGVNSSFMLRNLMVRGLVERMEEKEKGGAFQYGVSHAFLNHIGIPSTETLPDYSHYRDVLRRFMEQPTEGDPAKRVAGAPSS